MLTMPVETTAGTRDVMSWISYQMTKPRMFLLLQACQGSSAQRAGLHETTECSHGGLNTRPAAERALSMLEGT